MFGPNLNSKQSFRRKLVLCILECDKNHKTIKILCLILVKHQVICKPPSDTTSTVITAKTFSKKIIDSDGVGVSGAALEPTSILFIKSQSYCSSSLFISYFFLLTVCFITLNVTSYSVIILSSK